MSETLSRCGLRTPISRERAADRRLSGMHSAWELTRQVVIEDENEGRGRERWGCCSNLLLAMLVGALLLLASDGSARADDMQPAYLDVEELGSGALRVVWKVPVNQVLPARFAPVFPDSFREAPPRTRVETSTAVVESWVMAHSGEELGGSRLGIEGLEQTSMDVLVRIQFQDGSLHRVVLRPTDRFTTVPLQGRVDGQPAEGSGSRSRRARLGGYALLFCTAWGLSMTSGARRRGILLCSAALAVGSLAGHGLGRLPVQEKLFGAPLPSEVEAKRILGGLMLNTYRALMLDDDEETYDILARSVAGEFLNDIYLQNREALRMDAEDAALSLVNRLDVTAVESLERGPDGGVSMIVEWDVYGLVYHWEHVHFRCNTYRAELTIVPMDGYWKLTRLQLLDGKRVI